MVKETYLLQAKPIQLWMHPSKMRLTNYQNVEGITIKEFKFIFSGPKIPLISLPSHLDNFQPTHMLNFHSCDPKEEKSALTTVYIDYTIKEAKPIYMQP